MDYYLLCFSVLVKRERKYLQSVAMHCKHGLVNVSQHTTA